MDKKESALEVLNDVIRSKKHRQTWTKTHELIMKLFAELCVDLQRSAFAKDGLYQYRNICKDVSLNSFEVVSVCTYACIGGYATLGEWYWYCYLNGVVVWLYVYIYCESIASVIWSHDWWFGCMTVSWYGSVTVWRCVGTPVLCVCR